MKHQYPTNWSEITSKSNYGWSERGIKCVLKIPHKNKDVRFSLLFAITKKKIVKYYLKKGTINGEDFNNFMEGLDEKYKRYKYLMDNARIHHSKQIKEEIKKKIIYNVPYRPEYNPIKYVNNELKRQIKEQIINNEKEVREVIEKYIKGSAKKGLEKYYEKSYNNLGI